MFTFIVSLLTYFCFQCFFQGCKEYLVRWKNWDGEDTWEPEENLTGCDLLLADFNRRLAEQRARKRLEQETLERERQREKEKDRSGTEHETGKPKQESAEEDNESASENGGSTWKEGAVSAEQGRNATVAAESAAEKETPRRGRKRRRDDEKAASSKRARHAEEHDEREVENIIAEMETEAGVAVWVKWRRLALAAASIVPLRDALRDPRFEAPLAWYRGLARPPTWSDHESSREDDEDESSGQ